MNTGRLPEAGKEIEVTPEVVDGQMTLRPDRPSADFKRGIGELSETRDAMLMAQVLEEGVPVNGMTVYGAKDRIAAVSEAEARVRL